MRTPNVSNFEWWMTGLMSGSLVGGGLATLINQSSITLGVSLMVIGALGFSSIYYSMATS